MRDLAKTGKTGNVGFIVVTTDKGLCGGLNTNVLRAVTQKMRDVQSAGGKVSAVAIGNKGFGFLNRAGANVVSHVTQLGDAPNLERLIGPVQVMLAATHTKWAPWTLVDFNDQKAGRLKLIANLLSRLPVATASAPPIPIPPLPGKPKKEKFHGPLKPI